MKLKLRSSPFSLSSPFPSLLANSSAAIIEIIFNFRGFQRVNIVRSTLQKDHNDGRNNIVRGENGFRESGPFVFTSF